MLIHRQFLHRAASPSLTSQSTKNQSTASRNNKKSIEKTAQSLHATPRPAPAHASQRTLATQPPRTSLSRCRCNVPLIVHSSSHPLRPKRVSSFSLNSEPDTCATHSSPLERRLLLFSFLFFQSRPSTSSRPGANGLAVGGLGHPRLCQSWPCPGWAPRSCALADLRDHFIATIGTRGLLEPRRLRTPASRLAGIGGSTGIFVARHLSCPKTSSYVASSHLASSHLQQILGNMQKLFPLTHESGN